MKLKSMSWDEDSLTLIDLEGKSHTIFAEGECCSKSYIESIDDYSVFKNAILLSIEGARGYEKEHAGKHHEDDCHKWTFYKFTTDKGRATLSLRNESNGYYDGTLSVPKSLEHLIVGDKYIFNIGWE